MFQPEPGVYEKVHQIDFTSLYPSIIVKYNLSPETIEHPELKGFLEHRALLAAQFAHRDQEAEEDQPGLRRHRLGPEVDARNLLRLHRLPECQVRPDPGS